MKLIIIRHLPTSFNVDGLLQGRKDVPILPLDAEQKKTVIKNQTIIGSLEKFDHILASSLLRTQMTADHYTNHFTIEPLLDELDFGNYEGKKKQQMIKDCGNAWLASPDLLTFGEPVALLQKRVMQFLDKYIESKKILLFGHGAWIRAFISFVESGNIKKMNQIDIENNEVVERVV